MISNNSTLFQHYAATEASSLFHLSTGFAFLVSSAIPGDGTFRLAELMVGITLVVRGIMLEIESSKMVAGMLGAALNSYLSGLEPSQLSTALKSGWSILSVLAKTPVVSTAQTVSAAPKFGPKLAAPSRSNERKVGPTLYARGRPARPSEAVTTEVWHQGNSHH